MIKNLVIAAALAASITACTPVKEGEPGYEPAWYSKLTVAARLRNGSAVYKGPSGACYLSSGHRFSMVNCEDFMDE